MIAGKSMESGKIERGCSVKEGRREGEEEEGGDTVNFSLSGTMVQDGGLTIDTKRTCRGAMPRIVMALP